MTTVREIDPSVDAVRAFILSYGYGPAAYGAIVVRPYGRDERIGWDTCIVMVDDCAMAFTDGPLIQVTR
jgi:hypothetical protein